MKLFFRNNINQERYILNTRNPQIGKAIWLENGSKIKSKQYQHFVLTNEDYLLEQTVPLTQPSGTGVKKGQMWFSLNILRGCRLRVNHSDKCLMSLHIHRCNSSWTLPRKYPIDLILLSCCLFGAMHGYMSTWGKDQLVENCLFSVTLAEYIHFWHTSR